MSKINQTIRERLGMKLKRFTTQDIFGDLFILIGILGLTVAILFTPFFVEKYVKANHYITSGGVILLNQYRLFLSFGGLLFLLFGFHLAIEEKLKLTEKNKYYLAISSVIAICSLGALIRIYFYIVDRSLWFDEAMLALNIVNRSFAGLLKPLDWNQGAPIGFLWAEKLATSILGSKDYILRLFPLISGLASIPLIYLVSKKYVGQLSTFVTLILFVFSSRLIYYSSEAKQYSTDVLTALIILLIAPTIFLEKNKRRSFVLLGIVGVLTTWFSHPSVFVFAGVLLTAGVIYVIKRDLRCLLWLIGIGLVWGTNLGLDYFVSLRYSANSTFFMDYWKSSFAPLPPWSHIKWYFNNIASMLNDPATLPLNIITFGMLIIGVISFALKRWQSMMILLAPFAMVLTASALDKYPFSGRLILFLVPFLFLFLAEGIDRFRSVLQRVSRPLAWFFTAFFVLYFMAQPVIVAYNNIKTPPMGEDIKPVMLYVSENKLSNDMIYVYHGAVPAYLFYAPSYDGLNGKYIVGILNFQDPNKYLEQINKIGTGHRIWFIFSDNISRFKVNEQLYILEYLDKIGRKIDEYDAVGASVYLYELGQIR
ncbi:MAG: glycosyltransferase family 39 protein [Anaerolineales bacterium]